MGGGTGFCTLGVVQHIKPENVTLIDQSPHQLAKARAKPALKGVTILEVRAAGAGVRVRLCGEGRGREGGMPLAAHLQQLGLVGTC